MSQPANTKAFDTPEVTADLTDSELTPNVTTLKRVLNVSISGSLTKMSQDGDAACRWKPMDGKQTQMFGVETSDDIDVDAASNSLRGATVISARLLETKNEYPFTLGVTVSCLPKEEMVDTGDRYTYTALPASGVHTPYTLFEADSRTQESQRWRNKYKDFNASNLETEGVIEVKQCPYVFVKETHPVIDVLRANRELIGSDIDTHAKFDDEWFKISRQLLTQCCTALRSRVLNRLSTHDLNFFHVHVERVGGQDWLDIGDGGVALASFSAPGLATDEDISKAQQRHIDDFIGKEYQYSARLELTYELQH
eukprot:1894388-Rhodomonas_salina.4